MIPRLRVVLRCIFVLLVSGMVRFDLGQTLLSGRARAEPRKLSPTPDDTQELRVIESTEQAEDPLGIDRTTGADLDEAARRMPAAAPPPPPSPVQGSVLSALSQTQETEHEIFVRIEQGLAFVQIRMEFESRAKHSSELAYRLALPVGAVVLGISACRQTHACLTGAPVGATAEAARESYRSWGAATGPNREPALAVWAESIVDRTGFALAVRAAPLLPEGHLSLEVRYVVESPLRGGRARVHLPARGVDPRTAPVSTVRVSAPGFLPLEQPDEFSWDASLPIDLVAEWPAAKPVRPTSVRIRCGAGSCSRHHVAFGKAPLRTRPTWLWIDASPSMEGPARGRADVVLAALLTALPSDTPIAAHAFGASAKSLGRFPAEGAPLALLSDATMLDLGSATRPSVVVADVLDEIAKDRPRILILSDGQIDGHPEQRRALQQAQERGAELWLVTLQGTPENLGTSVRTLDVASEADRALKNGDLAEVTDALSLVLSEQARAGLRYGEQSVSENVPAAPFELDATGHWLSFWSARTRQPPPQWFASSGTLAAPFVAAIPYVSSPKEPEPAYSAMPAESVLELLRTQLVPKARACLRSDRRGRGDYAVTLSFRALFRRREVSQVYVDGKIPEHLRECLTELLPKLRVPAFSGGVRVRYPIHTDREPPPPVVEMTPEISESVQRVMAAPLHRP